MQAVIRLGPLPKNNIKRTEIIIKRNFLTMMINKEFKGKATEASP